MNIVDDRRDILRYARRARARQILVRSVEGFLRGLFWATGLAFLALAAHRLLGTPLPYVPAAIALGATALAAGLLTAFFPWIDLVRAAGAVDERAGWKERLSSALALASVDHPMERALLEDVRTLLKRHKPSELFPFRVPRELKWMPLVLVAIAAGYTWMPAVDFLGFQAEARQKQKDKEEVAETVVKLEKLRKDLQKDAQSLEKVKDILRKIEQLENELHKNPPPDKKETLAQITKLAEELQKLKNELGKSEALAEKLQKAASKDSGEAGELGQKLKEGKFAEAAQELAKLRNALQEGKLSKEEREKLKKQMEALAEKLGKDKELSEFEKKLREAMQGMELGQEQMMDGLQQALSGLDGELDQADSLEEALKDLESLADALAKEHGECPS
jgi:hypothetical protein